MSDDKQLEIVAQKVADKMISKFFEEKPIWFDSHEKSDFAQFQKIDKSYSDLNNKLTAYIRTDNEWKESVKPVIELGTNVRGFGKGFVYIVGIAVAIAGVAEAIIKIFYTKNG